MIEPEVQKMPFEISTGGGRFAGPLVDFLYAVQPKAEDLFRRHCLDTAQAEEILTATVQVLVWKWETVRNREAWLLAILDRKCRLVSGRSTENLP